MGFLESRLLPGDKVKVFFRTRSSHAADAPCGFFIFKEHSDDQI